MGLFDKLFQSNQSRAKELKLSKEEAFLGIVLSAVAADEVFSQEEMHAMSGVLGRMMAFRRLNQSQILDMLNKFTYMIRREGVGTMVDAAKHSLDQKTKETAFAVAVDMVLADGTVDAKEKQFLEHLQRAVGISDSLAEKIVEVLIIKNRGAGQDWYESAEKGKQYVT